MNEDNAMQADVIDENIKTIKDTSTRVLTEVNDFNIMLTSLPAVSQTLRLCSEMALELGKNCKNVERELVELEDIQDRLDLEAAKRKHHLEMAVYKEKKLGLAFYQCYDRLWSKCSDGNVFIFQLNWKKFDRNC